MDFFFYDVTRDGHPLYIRVCNLYTRRYEVHVVCDVFSEINPIFFLFRDFQERDVEDIYTHTIHHTPED